ncbi:uncharacterized protein LOC118478370 [Aplysia californica]|uniref:Uncharacterized protein LOC118478370 n=1 Tax=Aplysia californica TaxID=6500 RepID=A0ABM1VZ83_APLCA|nr:uncharacterized protein LOC118478370 [Aplysia californica]
MVAANKMNSTNASIVFVACVAFRDSEDSLSQKDREDIEDMCDLSLLLEEILIWVSVSLGLPGNLVAAVTILSLELTPVTFSLALLSVGDFIALVLKVLTKVFKDYAVITTEDVSHDWFYNLHHYAGVYANWTLVLICLGRLADVLDPFRKTFKITLRLSYVTALVLWLVVIIIYATVCQVESYGNRAWVIVFSTCYCFIPLPIVLVSSVVFAIELKRGQKRRNIMSDAHVRQLASQDNAMTALMLADSFAFAVLISPLCVVMLVHVASSYTWVSPHHTASASFFMAAQVSAGLSQLSHGVDVYLYFVSVKRFRLQLRKILPCKMFEVKLNT